MLAIGIGGLTALCMPSSVDWEIRVLGGWDAGILSFLSQMGYMMLVASPEQTITYARSRGVNSASILSLVVLTACTSIFVIGVMLTDSKDTSTAFSQHPNLALSGGNYLLLAAHPHYVCAALCPYLLQGMRSAQPRKAHRGIAISQ